MTKGLVASSDPRAAEIGAEMLRSGGNAADAAVAAALVLYVVEPHFCGAGGDGFFIWSVPGADPVGLDGSGAFPLGLTEAALRADGLEAPPGRGPRSVTVPGALALLEDAAGRFGSLSLEDVTGPAIAFARQGYEARQTLARAAERAAAELATDPVLAPLYLPDERPVAEGQRLANGALADLLSEFASNGAAEVYRGAVAEAIASRVGAAGGYLAEADLERHQTIVLTPASWGFREVTVWEMPSPTQGPAVLNALGRLGELPPLTGEHPDWSPVVEAIIEGMAEAGFDLRKIGTAAAGQAMRSAPAAAAEVRVVGRGDTTYIAAFDENGSSASLITSVFGDFGSYFGVPELGGPLLNRAAMLRVLAEPPRPGEKPPHTTIPASVTRDGSPAFALGVAGGFMQAQAQVQILIHLLDRGLTPQQAVDEPRFRVTFGGDLALEPGHPLAESHPEALDRPTDREGFGCAQIAGLFGGRLSGAADPRRGGAVASSV